MDSQLDEGWMPNLGSRWILQKKDCPMCVWGRVDSLLHQDSKGNEGEIFEVSKEANAYRAEQLGLCALHNLIAAFSVFYEIENGTPKLDVTTSAQ